MDISVIIPTYKPKEYLWECLDSLNYQTLSKDRFEVLLILNGCNEPWNSEITIRLNTTYKELSINFIQTDTPGVSNARNLGLQKAKGDYICFVDDDDYVSPSYLEDLLKTSSINCVALTDSIYFDDNTLEKNLNNIHHKEYVKLSSDSIKLNLFNTRRFFNGPVMKLVHKSIIENRKFDPKFKNGEDSLFMALISNKIKEVKFTPSSAIYYRRIRTNSATTHKRSNKQKIANAHRLISKYISYWISNPLGYNSLFMISRILASLKIY